MSKALILAVVFLCAGQASAGSPGRLKDLESMLEHLRAGGEVRAVLDWGVCRLQSLKTFSETPARPDETADPRCRLSMHGKPPGCYYSSDNKLKAVSGMKLDTWEYFAPGFLGPRGYLSASAAQLISIRGFVLNYGSVKVYDDNSVAVKINYLKPAFEARPDPAITEETPLLLRREDGRETLVSKKLSQQDYLIVMDEMFTCEISSRSDSGGASFFAAD
ncbi:MAG TPA: hypothetical protein DEQ38_10415 [Elusimicrobia bacterium]|nr:MAG: hypothetical protein A2089_11825 [Elusimicrobia bacterium GWD2_63_28]HCC48509.1 hypothetical protein [Elusimicrobiota bacterium]